jgi:uncharacterized protein YdeI (YjbR/CyaY-like superfamily)
MTTHEPDKVEKFMNNLNHPLKEEIEAVRNIIKSTNSEFTEKIKWNAPSYSIQNKDRITFNLHGKGFFRLIFHCGVKVKEGNNEDQLFVDTTGLLDWVSPDRAIIKFTNKSDVIRNEEKLREIIAKWLKVTV